jgi:NDP-sugar pyrophosphorylase family protein
MDVLVLTGGQGSRLRSVVSDRPKTMAAINGRPFLDLLLDHLQAACFSRFILCAGYMGDYIVDYYKTESASCREILISRETRPLGTAGAVKHAEPLIHGDSFLIVNGDSFCAVDLTAFISFHQQHAALASMVLAHTETAQSYGTVSLGQNHRIVQFKEKSTVGQAWVNAGIYLFDRDVLNRISSEDSSSLEHDIFPHMVDQRFFGFITKSPVIDIGTPERYLAAQRNGLL